MSVYGKAVNRSVQRQLMFPNIKHGPHGFPEYAMLFAFWAYGYLGDNIAWLEDRGATEEEFHATENWPNDYESVLRQAKMVGLNVGSL